MKKEKTWKKIYMLTLFVLSLLLFNLNNITTLFYPYPVKKIDFNSLQSNSPVHATIHLTYGNDFHHTFVNSGWDYAFCETEHDNSERRVEVIFKSEDAAYAYPCDLTVIDEEKAETLEYSGSPSSSAIGFFVEMSTIHMKNGIYEVYIYVYENEFNYGLVFTDLKYKKQYESFSYYRDYVE